MGTVSSGSPPRRTGALPPIRLALMAHARSRREMLAPFSNRISDEPLVAVTVFAGEEVLGRRGGHASADPWCHVALVSCRTGVMSHWCHVAGRGDMFRQKEKELRKVAVLLSVGNYKVPTPRAKTHPSTHARRSQDRMASAGDIANYDSLRECGGSSRNHQPPYLRLPFCSQRRIVAKNMILSTSKPG